MSGPRFIVPPSSDEDKDQQTNAPIVKSPVLKTESKISNWVKNNKNLSIVLVFAFVIVGLSGTVLVTKKSVNLFGVQLNPMYNKANLNPCDLTDPLCEPGGGGGGGTGTTITGTAPTGFQVSVKDLNCNEQEGTSAVAGPNGGASATDTNQKDPDCARIRFITPDVSAVDTNTSIYTNDFRIGTKLAESENGCSAQADAEIKWTPWASDGGGSSSPAVGQSSSNDPDCVWIYYEARPMPEGKAIRDARVGISSGGALKMTPWARQGGGWSQYSTGSNIRPTAVHLESTVFTPTPTPSTIDMAGDFPAGVINEPFSTTLSLSGNPVQPCTWDIVSTTPSLDANIAVSEGENATTTASFSATPTVAGNYQIVIKATCQNGQTIEKTFSWDVNGIRQPPENPIDITGVFSSGTVGQAYSTNLTLTGTPSVPCTWSVVSVSPTVTNPSVSGSNSDGTTAIFRATPLLGRAHQVILKATCANGQTAEKSFPWTVRAGGGTPATVSITGNFPNGRTFENYTTNLSTLNAGTSDCTFSLISVSPPVNGATIVRVDNITAGSETTGLFTARPVGSGNYTVRVSVSCPDSGGGATKSAQQDFPWIVTTIVAPAPISITGNFPNGKAGTAYSTNLNTLNAGSSSCTFSLISVSPPVNGATIVRVDNITAGSETTGEFRATPQTAGNYIVRVSVSCPDSGGGATKSAQQDFPWVVTSSGGGGGGGGGGGSNPNKDTCMDSSNLTYLVAIYRFWSPSAGDHLYTTNVSEKPAGYRFEGIAGYVYNRQLPNTKAIHRSAQRTIGSHYYTTGSEDPTTYGYADEGIIGYAFESAVTGSSPWYRMHKGGATSDYVHTISETERQAVKELGYADLGTVAFICGGSQPTELQPIFRLWGNNDKNHFYTTNFAERDAVLTKGYVSEGIAGYIYGVRKSGSVPLYRSYSTTAKDHLYTTNEVESRTPGYRQEGIMGYLASTEITGTTSFFRLYNPFIKDHFYTSSDAEANAAISSGYTREGVSGYLYLQSQ